MGKTIYRSPLQKLQWSVVDKLEEKIHSTIDKRDFLMRCGLDKEAKRFNGEIVRLSDERKELIDTIDAERRRLAMMIPKVLLLCDILCTVNDEFADAVNEAAGAKTRNDLSRLVDENLHRNREVVKEWERLVCHLDEIGNRGMSWYFADVSDAYHGRMKSMLDEFMRDLEKNKNFKKYFK